MLPDKRKNQLSVFAAAILEEENNKQIIYYLHENEIYFPQRRNMVILRHFSNMAAANTLYQEYPELTKKKRQRVFDLQ